jgi:polyisoprenoid-binding protein YceI
MKAIYLFISIFISVFSTPTEKGKEPVQFQIKNAGITVDGTISDWEYAIVWDIKKLANCKISGRANPVSIDTGIKLRDKHLLGRQYFHVEKFPAITLQSKRILSKGKGRYIGVFDLQIRDVRKEIELPFTVTSKNNQLIFTGEFIINRLDYQLGEPSMVLNNEVTIFIELVN